MEDTAKGAQKAGRILRKQRNAPKRRIQATGAAYETSRIMPRGKQTSSSETGRKKQYGAATAEGATEGAAASHGLNLNSEVEDAIPRSPGSRRLKF
jgi:hypothetical protein